MNSTIILTAPAWRNKHGCISFSCNKKESEQFQDGATYAIVIIGKVEEAEKNGGRIHIETAIPLSKPIPN